MKARITRTLLQFPPPGPGFVLFLSSEDEIPAGSARSPSRQFPQRLGQSEFFELVDVGTPVHIAHHQPEDATIGRKVSRPTDYADPDPPINVLISPSYFRKKSGTVFAD